MVDRLGQGGGWRSLGWHKADLQIVACLGFSSSEDPGHFFGREGEIIYFWGSGRRVGGKLRDVNCFMLFGERS